MKPLKAIARRALDAAKVFLSFSAREILRREPVITGGLLVSVGLAVAAWFGFHPSSDAQQVWQTVAAAVAPSVTALLASMATWSPASHAATIAAGAHVAPPPATAEPAGGGV